MDTTVTGLFQTQSMASLATTKLIDAGFGPEQIRIVDAESPDRHEVLGERAADTKRGVVLGIGIGMLLGVVAGAALGSVFGMVPAVLGGTAVGLLGGTVLGLLVGRATTTQVQDELEHQVDAGTVMVTVKTDGAHAPQAVSLLAKEGGTSM